MDSDKNKAESTKVERDVEQHTDDIQESSDETKKLKKSNKLMPIEMSDGTTMYMDTNGMKSTEIQKFKDNIFEFIDGELNGTTRKKESSRVNRPIKTKSKPEKSKKLKNR